MLDQAFAQIGEAFSAVFGDPFHDAIAHWPGTPVYDAGGSIVTPGTPIAKTCRVQVDAVTQAMRQSAGFADGDVRLFVLAATLDGGLDTDAQIEVLEGPNAGRWMIADIERDPVGAYWQCRGRRA